MSTMNERIGRMVTVAWRPVAGLIGLVGLVVWSSGWLDAKVRPGKVDQLPGIDLPAQAQTMTVKRVLSPSWIEVVGTVVAEQRVSLSARIPAAIQTMSVAAGDSVTQGQVLATLDDRAIREQWAGADAQLRQAEAECNRAQALFDKGATTDQALLAARTQLEAARAGVQQVRVMLSYAVITAPFDGVVTDRRFEPGDLAAPGMVLMTVYNPHRMRLDVPVPVRLLSRFTLNGVEAVVLDGVDHAVKGTVSEVVSEVDPLSRTRTAKVRLDAIPNPVLPGTYGRITVEGDAHEAVWVPASAVYRVGQQELVQVVTGGRVLRRLVRTGVGRDDRIEVIAGLDDGDVNLVEPVKER